MATEPQIYAIGTCALGIIANRITLYAIRYTKYERPIMTLIMQNKPNLNIQQCSLTNKIKRTYNDFQKSNVKKTNPKQTQTNPKQTQSQKAKNQRNFCYNRELRRKSAFHPPKKQTQFKPKQTQFNRVNPRNPWLGIFALLYQAGSDLAEEFVITWLFIIRVRIWKRLPLSFVERQCNLGIHALPDIDTVGVVFC